MSLVTHPARGSMRACSIAAVLRRNSFAGNVAFPCSSVSQNFRMSSSVAQPQVLTSAYMAAGMTSRARRPEPRHSAG